MMRRFPPLALVFSTLLASPVLHAELGSIAPVTLVLTVTGLSGALPDANQDGVPDWEKRTSTATKYTYEYKTKYVTTKLTNAALLSELVKDNVIADVNYSLVMALDDKAAPFGFYLVRKGETTIATTPVNVTGYLHFNSMADIFLTATSLKYTEQLSNSVATSSSYNTNIELKGPVEIGMPPLLQAYGMYSASIRYDAAQDLYLTTSAKITSVTGGYLAAGENEQPVTVEGSINFAAAKAVDVAIFPRSE